MGSTDADGDVPLELWTRIHHEFRVTPGLRLTAAQAARLWNTDVAVSRRVLDALVETTFLRRDEGLYMRADPDQGSI